MIMATSSPGVFGGDRLQQIIRVGRGAGVRLTSQSALQVHASRDATIARIENTYHVEENGRLHCQWDPLIPFAGARLDQQIEIHVADSGSLLWSDALLAGRHARGERWMFAALGHELKVFVAGSLAYLERYRLGRDEPHATRTWAAGDAVYLGTAFASGLGIEPEAAERLHADLTAIAGVKAAVDWLDRRMLLVRLMGRSGPPFHSARTHVHRALA
jgi:urease accessory protein